MGKSLNFLIIQQVPLLGYRLNIVTNNVCLHGMYVLVTISVHRILSNMDYIFGYSIPCVPAHIQDRQIDVRVDLKMYNFSPSLSQKETNALRAQERSVEGEVVFLLTHPVQALIAKKPEGIAS